MRLFRDVPVKDRWVGTVEVLGMLLVLLSFYYQAFYEGDALTARYDNMRFKLDLIQEEVIHNSDLIGGQDDYNLGNVWKGLNANRRDLNRISEDHISTIDQINEFVSSVRTWIFIAGSALLIIAKFLQHFWFPAAATVQNHGAADGAGNAPGSEPVSRRGRPPPSPG